MYAKHTQKQDKNGFFKFKFAPNMLLKRQQEYGFCVNANQEKQLMRRQIVLRFSTKLFKKRFRENVR